MDLEPYFAKIEQYATGQLPENERLAFEAELATDVGLRQALDLYRIGNESIEQGIENSLRQQLRVWANSDADIVTEKPAARVVNMRPLWARWAVAASVVLLAGWFFFQWAGRNYSDEALYSANYQLPETPTLRSGSGLESPLGAGYKALESKDFQAAEVFFQTIPSGDARYEEAQYYLGHAALQLKHFDLAISAFQQVFRNNEAKFKEKAEWNLLLTYLAAGRSQEADFKTQLERISADSQHSYQRQAQALQQKLQSLLRNVQNGAR